MDSKKSKKKLFAIIGSSVLAFILTVVVSVAVTLAYFGDEAANSTEITMDRAVVLLDADEAEGKQIKVTGVAEDHKVLPGEKVAVNGEIALDEGSLEAFLAVKVTVTTDNEEFPTTSATIVTPDGWVYDATSGYYFYAEGTDADAANAVMTQATDAAAVDFGFDFIVPTGLGNEAANATLTVSYDVIAVQGFAFDGDGEPIDSPKLSQVLAMFDQYDPDIVADNQVEGN